MKKDQSAITRNFRHMLAIAVFLSPASVVAAPPGLMHSPKPQVPVTAVRSPGARIFRKWCSECHSSAIGPGTKALERKYRGRVPAILEQRTDLRPDFVRYVVRHGMSFMPPFRKTEITDAELARLARYLARSSGTSGTSREMRASGQPPVE